MTIFYKVKSLQSIWYLNTKIALESLVLLSHNFYVLGLGGIYEKKYHFFLIFSIFISLSCCQRSTIVKKGKKKIAGFETQGYEVKSDKATSEIWISNTEKLSPATKFYFQFAKICDITNYNEGIALKVKVEAAREAAVEQGKEVLKKGLKGAFGF